MPLQVQLILSQKSNANSVNSVGYKTGSYEQQQGTVTLGKQLENSALIGHASINTSEGYRYNTDFENQNYFIKGRFNANANPIDVIGYLAQAKIWSKTNFMRLKVGAINMKKRKVALLALQRNLKPKHLK